VKPTAVLVETNWVVDVIAPAHLQGPQAAELLQRAQSSEFELSKIWVKTPSFYDGFKLQWKKR
jgi:hypothetical protein